MRMVIAVSSRGYVPIPAQGEVAEGSFYTRHRAWGGESKVGMWRKGRLDPGLHGLLQDGNGLSFLDLPTPLLKTYQYAHLS